MLSPNARPFELENVNALALELVVPAERLMAVRLVAIEAETLAIDPAVPRSQDTPLPLMNCNLLALTELTELVTFSSPEFTTTGTV